MARNLDLTALRAFVTIAEAGGVTKAAGLLHLTQSAVSMQIKRLEGALDQPLYFRTGRSLELTAHGEMLLGYARQMLSLNDEIWGRMTAQEFEGVIKLGVPSDIVYPHIPGVLQTFAAEYPRVNVQLVSSFTSVLKKKFDAGDVDITLTTEKTVDPHGETLVEEPIVWVGAPGGSAWRRRPVRLAFETKCLFRTAAQHALDEAGLRWEMAVQSDSTRTIEASISADLAIHACLEATSMTNAEVIPHGGELPELPPFKVNLYMSEGPSREMVHKLGALIRSRYLESRSNRQRSAG